MIIQSTTSYFCIDIQVNNFKCLKIYIAILKEFLIPQLYLE